MVWKLQITFARCVVIKSKLNKRFHVKYEAVAAVVAGIVIAVAAVVAVALAVDVVEAVERQVVFKNNCLLNSYSSY
ncbi:DUF2613 family protein [Bacteroides sp.]|uniref:DUF2613 family protein n=1 Tax=Bacteroides sp. TaxID=29523 RepID=UPI0034585017